MLLTHLDTTRFFYQSLGLSEHQNQPKNDFMCIVVYVDVPEENGASLGQLAYCIQ